jgi:hypothetical protein
MNAYMPALLTGSILLAALMGFAIQRGATCTVAAVDELLNHGRSNRLVSLAEAAIWVGLGVLLARQAGLIMQVPSGHAAGWRTVLGGVLLGGGAYVNRACVFGAIARWASGDWAYAATPLGFFLGSVVILRVAQSMGSPKLMQASPAQALPDGLVLLFVGLLLCRALWLGWRSWHEVSAASTAQPVWRRVQQFGARVWSPRPATIIIGLTFLGMMLMAGPWAYTELLSQWAAGMSQQAVIKILLAVALFSGAGLGGWTAGKWHWHGVQWMGIARCLAGGALMGMGSLLIPGGNDGLILVGMPMLWPYAWLAFATMCVTIASLMLLARR